MSKQPKRPKQPKKPTPPRPRPTTKAAPAEPERDTEPVRTCVGCRRRAPTTALVRITRADRSVVVGGPSRGRGAWLCRDVSAPASGAVDPACLAAALRKRAFERAWRGSLDDEERTALAGLARHAADFAGRPDAP